MQMLEESFSDGNYDNQSTTIYDFIRIERENPLCSTKTLGPNGLIWRRPNIFKNPSAAQLRTFVRQVNLMDPQQTLLPQFDRAHMNCIAGGPYQVFNIDLVKVKCQC